MPAPVLLIGMDDAPRNDSFSPDQAAITYPDGGYGWVCVACCLTINAMSWGIVASYGVYLAFYLTYDVFPDSQSGDFALIGGLNFAAAMAVTPLVSILSRRLGPHPPMLLGAFLLGAGFIAASFAERIWQLYVSQGMLIGLGVGLLYLPTINIIPQWFSSKRSLASAISSAGSGLGGLIFSFTTGSMISHLSLAWSLRITGIVAAVFNTLAALLIRDRDAIIRPKYNLLDVSLLKKVNVLFLLSWEIILLFGYIAIQFSLSDFGLSINLSRKESDAITAILNVGTACVRPCIGFLSDKFGRIKIAMVLTLLTGVLCFSLWIPATGFAASTVFATLVGGIYGVFWATIGPVSAEVIGIRRLPSLLSLVWISAIPPTILAEYLVLKLKRASPSRQYLFAQIFAALTFTTAAIFLYFIERRLKRYQ